MVSAIGDMLSRSLRTFLRPVMPLWEDPQVMELVIHGSSEIWVDRGRSLEKVEEIFPADQLSQAIRQIGQLVGVLINEENPHLSKQLPDGTELSIAVPPLAKAGPIVAIRKGQYEQSTLGHLIESDFLTAAVAEFVQLSLEAQQSILLVGATGSGVQTLFQALIRSLPSGERLVRLERESPTPLEHPHIMSFSLSPECSERVPLQSLLSTVMMLRPHRVLVERMGQEDVATLLPWLSGGFPGSVATLRAFSVEHAVQVLEMWGLCESPGLSVTALRSQVASAFPLVVACKRLANGTAQVDAVTELLPLSDKGDCRVLPLFRRRFLDRSRTPESAVDEPSGVLLPVGHIPSFWSHVRHLRGGLLDRAFFHPANYNSEGVRLENKAIPAMAPVGVLMEESEERETRSRPATVERDVRELRESREASNEARSTQSKGDTPALVWALESKLRKRLQETVLPESTDDEEDDADETFLQHSSPEAPPTEAPLSIGPVGSQDHSKDIPTEPGQSLSSLMNEAEESKRSLVAPSVPPAFSAPPMEDSQTLVRPVESTVLPNHSSPKPTLDKAPTRVAPQQATFPPLDLAAAIPGLGPSHAMANSQQVILGGKGLMDSQEISSALTVSRTTPPRANKEGVSTAPHVPLEAEMLAVRQDIDTSSEEPHSLDISDMVVEEENSSVMSEADLRWVEQELREKAPLRQRDNSPHLATEVVPREMMAPKRPALPEQDLYTDPEDTFRHGQHTPVLNQGQPQSETVRELSSVDDDPDLTHIPARFTESNGPSSVMVRRGSRQVIAPNPSSPEHTADISGASTSIRGRSPLVEPVFGADQNERKGPPPIPSQGSLPSAGPSRPIGPPPLPGSRPQGIRPPSSPPPQMLSLEDSSNDEGPNEATLIRGRRPPPYKKD